MCGRYILYSDKEERAIKAIVEEVNQKYQTAIEKVDIYPTDLAPTHNRMPVVIPADQAIDFLYSTKTAIKIMNENRVTLKKELIQRSDSLLTKYTLHAINVFSKGSQAICSLMV